jgi:hypothetical protein
MRTLSRWRRCITSRPKPLLAASSSRCIAMSRRICSFRMNGLVTELGCS